MFVQPIFHPIQIQIAINSKTVLTSDSFSRKGSWVHYEDYHSILNHGIEYIVKYCNVSPKIQEDKDLS